MHSPQQPKRRNFIKLASATSIASTAGGLPALFASNAALAQEVLGTDVFATLTKIARDIFPHDRFDDALYSKAVAGYGDQVKQDADLKKLLTAGVAAVDDAARKQFGKSYVAVAAEKDRVAILKAMEKTPFFAKIRATWWSVCTTSQRSGPSSGIRDHRRNSAAISNADSTTRAGWIRFKTATQNKINGDRHGSKI